jgi:hypothetical protein
MEVRIRGVLVKKHLKPRPDVPQFQLVMLCVGFRTELLNRIFDVTCYGFHNQFKLLGQVQD